MTTVEALKSLYTAMGGRLEDVTNISTNPDMINALCEVASGMQQITVETIVGTVAEPWGDHSYSDLVAGISNKTLIVKIESVYLNAFGVVSGGKIQFSRAYLYPGLEYAGDLDGCSYLYKNTGVLEYAAIAQGNETVEAVAPTTATTLTIIHVDYSTT